jgi:hypothetical protein
MGREALAYCKRLALWGSEHAEQRHEAARDALNDRALRARSANHRVYPIGNGGMGNGGIVHAVMNRNEADPGAHRGL